ncbi:hypothetical protein [Moorella sp. Hama-1]|uniref:hypothetical protein n=1 Tax=Moorella sp. Hama-1 TaxID=2138101 RepID=UPI000D657695|nr:hypothetical protein [Moorella sp. Hama-1]BCV20222.1 hypothetical protein hamaS1_02910 [Moorella sp. Hama-1]
MASEVSGDAIMTAREKQRLASIAEKLANLQRFLNTINIGKEHCNLEDWYKTVSTFKRLLGNFDNDVSFIACLIAKHFLSMRHDLPLIDIAAKPQGAPGLDLDVTIKDGKRIIAEIKTTISYHTNDLGAQQRETFLRDFKKLRENKADYKYFFVTERDTYEVIRRHYTKYLTEEISLVLLPPSGLEITKFVLKGEIATGSELSSEQPHPVTSSPSPSSSADLVRQFIQDNYFEPAKRRGVEQLILRSGDIHRKMNLHNRYPLVCSVMRGRKIERMCDVRIIKTEGSDGANFYVTYSLV